MTDPALIFHDSADRAGMHVLLIGVGDYPWLEDGDQYVPEKHEDNAVGMGQLAAPPVSIRHLADWFLTSFQNPDRELASVSLLLSEKTPAPFTHDRVPGGSAMVPRGEIEEVQDAVDAWIDRASARRDNSLIFGFCGHGLQSGNPVLLCRDYGKVPTSRFRGAINFEQFRIALSTHQPDTQLFLIDACRTPDLENALLGQATPGNGLLDLESLSNRDNAPAMQSVQFATSLFTEAWGRTEGPSLFTEVLLKALKGGAAEHTAEWWVTTSRLHTVLSTYLQRVSLTEGVIQRPAAQSQDFRIAKPGPIEVDLYVNSREPAVWREKVEIEARRGTFQKKVVHDPPLETDTVTAPSCLMQLVNPTQRAADVIYNVEARFANGSQFQNCAEDVIAYPPEVVCDLPVSRRP
ncbi:caspase family protein [Sphingopyxis sp.]|uniref:caspase family protein n=1 Tax=Sphingopyxis sp. TaxID=1908224 RepID=UPI002D771BAB|nr:caspase family protein [Sphingopyxis sp.]HET6523183.1 caspase family protein [Sphingopyxis sp.]